MRRLSMFGILMLALTACSVTQRAERDSELAPLYKNTVVVAAAVKSGNCVLIKCPNGSQILNDCGSLDKGTESAVKMIKEQIAGTSSLFVAISHPDRDHYNLIP